MPLIKELEDLMPLVADMREEYQQEAAEGLRRIIVSDDYCKGMTQEEALKLMLLDLTAQVERRKRK